MLIDAARCILHVPSGVHQGNRLAEHEIRSASTFGGEALLLFFSSGLATSAYDYCPCAKIAWRVRFSRRVGHFQTVTSALPSVDSMVAILHLF
jgi:hypothetical protein